MLFLVIFFVNCEVFCNFDHMKTAKILNHNIWIINTLRAYGSLTFEEIRKKWQEDNMSDGNALARSSFNRYRDAIADMFGIVIECDLKTYRYYIRNQDVLCDDSIERWLFSTLTVHGVLSDSAAVKDRVVLENVPSGLEFLDTILTAIKNNHRIELGYQKFGTEGYVKIVCPYAVKLFHQRWYMLARTVEDQMRIYALDRIQSLSLTEETFVMPEDFSPQGYFAEYFGVLTDSTVPMAHVVIRAHDWTPDYLRTLPLHHSQRELTSTEQYTDFSFDIRPTADFLGQLLSHGSGIEVLEPLELRQKIRDLIAENLRRY